MYVNIKNLLISFFAIISAYAYPIALADHDGPERIVDGKYLVSLSIIPVEGRARSEMNMRFFFKDTLTGRALEMPIVMDVTAREADTGVIIFEKNVEASGGVGSIVYQFPKSEIYIVQMNFQKSDEPGKVYGPLTWEVWVPGLVQGDNNYPLGGSEIAGFSILAIFLIILTGNFFQLRQRRKKDNYDI